ncbi:MAG: HAMP domain-containing sensor histidine kinase [Planctomycetota bacterium]
MRLRTRLAVTMVGLALPLGALAIWIQGRVDRAAELGGLRAVLAARMVEGRAECEADPERFPEPARAGGRGERGPGRSGFGSGPGASPGPGPPRPERPDREGPPLAPRPPDLLRLFAYGDDFESANPRAPGFPPGLRAELVAGATHAAEWVELGGIAHLRLAERMPWEGGPCAIVVAWRPSTSGRSLSAGQLVVVATLTLALVASAFLAGGPLVGRIRRLSAAVALSAADRYATQVPVEGNDELSELARAFNAAGGELGKQLSLVEARDLSLRSFVANTMHDVMVPMTVLQGHLATLRDGQAHDPGVLREAIEEVHYMTGLLANLAAIAKLESGALELELHPVDLNALVERVAARHRGIARQRGVELNHAVPEHPLRVRGDVTLLEQAVGNLVHNAVRYVPDAGHVAILLDGEAPERWSLRVVDDGPGIPESLLARLTEPDERGPQARTRHPEGQGLGLHIALEVARRHAFALHLGRSEYGGLEARMGPA